MSASKKVFHNYEEVPQQHDANASASVSIPRPSPSPFSFHAQQKEKQYTATFLITTHILMIFSMALYAGNYVFFRCFFAHGHTAFLFSFLRTILSIFFLPMVYFYEYRLKERKARLLRKSSEGLACEVHDEDAKKKHQEDGKVSRNNGVDNLARKNSRTDEKQADSTDENVYHVGESRKSEGACETLGTFKLKREAIFCVTVASLAGAVRQIIVPVALMFTTAQNGGIIQPAVPVFTSCLAIFIGLEKFGWLVFLSVFTCSLGLACAGEVWNTQHVDLGFHILLGVPVSKGLQVIGLQCSTQYHKAAVVQFYQIIGLILFTIPVSFSVEFCVYCKYDIRTFWAKICELDGVSWGAVVYSAVAIILICWRIQLLGVEVIGTIGVSLYQSFQPVFAFLMSYFLLHEKITLMQIIGGIIVCIGLFVHQLGHYYEHRMKQLVETKATEAEEPLSDKEETQPLNEGLMADEEKEVMEEEHSHMDAVLEKCTSIVGP